MENIYKAKDGRTFDDEYDCKLYELFLNEHTKGQIRGLDADFNIVPFSNSSFAKDVQTIIIKTKEALQVFDEWAEGQNRGFCGIESPGVYMTEYLIPVEYYDENCWVSVDEIIEILQGYADEERAKLKALEDTIKEVEQIKNG